MFANASVNTFMTVHSESEALKETTDFIRTLFIENDVKAAYEKSHEVMRSKLTFAKFKAVADSVNKENEKYEITHILVNRENNKISVYVEQIDQSNETLYFGVLLIGSSITGYRVAGIRYSSHDIRPKELEKIIVVK